MNYLILGAGLMGRAAAFDLLRHEDTKTILLADIKFEQAKKVAQWLNDPRVKPLTLDVTKKEHVREVMEQVDTAIGCVSYQFNYELSKTAIETKTNYCDLGGNNTVVSQQFSLHEEAKKAGITIIPDCGLAPGVASILTAYATEKFDTLEEIHIRVGGLPQNPKPPLNYSLIFNVKGLTNEYLEPAEIIRDGKLMKVESLTEIEEITFPSPFGKLEAFQTSGGTSTLPKTFLGKVRELDYKTIRYKGHCERIKTIFDLGFREEQKINFKGCKISPREFLEFMLVKSLTHKDTKDVTLLRLWVIGKQKNNRKRFTLQIIDYFDEQTNLTSMMRMTAFPVAIIARMITKGQITKKGVIVQEFNIPSGKMLEELRKRQIVISEELEEL
ncbi:MAG: saccharopine dehydrogenase family protein [Candidatus Heimdallarchaeota archaeon]